MIYTAITILLVSLVALALLVALIVRTAAKQCAFCGGNAVRFERLPDGERQQVRAYFLNVERGMPRAGYVWVCKSCHRVSEGRTPGSGLSLEIQCKACGAFFTRRNSMTCTECGRRQEWTTFAQCGEHQFLLPLKTEKGANMKEQT